jgi:hypothetical protein
MPNPLVPAADPGLPQSTRRRFLRALGLGGIALAVPAAAAAQTSPEPEIAALATDIEAAYDLWRAADERFAAAYAQFRMILPPPPESIRMTADAPMQWITVQNADREGALLDEPDGRCTFIYTSDAVRRELKRHDGRTREARALRRILPDAERYQAAKDAAWQAAECPESHIARLRAEQALRRALIDAAERASQLPGGEAVTLRAMALYTTMGQMQMLQSAFAPALARMADISAADAANRKTGRTA